MTLKMKSSCWQQSALLSIGFVMVIGVPSALADIIYLRGGQKQVGIITQDVAGRSTVTIRTIGGEIAIPRDKIEKIEAETPAASHARLGDQFLDAGKNPEAVAAYRTALESDKDNASIAAKLRQAESGLKDDAVAAMEAGDVRVQQIIASARELVATKKFEEAVKSLKDVEPTSDSPVAGAYRKAMAEIHYAWGLDRLDRTDASGAAEKFGISIKFDPTNEQARQQLIRAWEGDPTKLREVTEFYVKSQVPEDQLKVADAYFKLREYEKALPIYLKFADDPSYGSENIQERLRLIFDVLHEQYARQGDYVRALDTYQKLITFAPNTDPAPLTKYDFMIRRSQTDMNDMNARAELAKFAEESGLMVTAREEFQNILKVDPKNVEATAGLKRFASAELQEAQDYFLQAQYLLAAQKAEEVTRTYAAFQDIVKQAQELYTKAQLEQQQVAKDNLKQAAALALRGDDYYAQAMSYYSSYVSNNLNRTTTNVFSPRNEAAKYFGQAIYAWQTALRIDSSLGDQTSYNLIWKIADAQRKYAVMANRLPPRMPKRDLDRLSRGQNVPGSK